VLSADAPRGRVTSSSIRWATQDHGFPLARD
jgi:hypothetical protein